MNRQSELLKEAMRHMPEGVAENYRYWGPDRTVFIQRAKGCELFDVDGKTYVDFRLGYGPIILGYGDERVDKAVIAQIQSGGTLTGFATELDTLVVQQIKAGKLRALAVTGVQRSKLMPELPTIAEGGGPAMSAQVWYGVVAPARTPREIVQRLYGEIEQIVKLPATRERMLQNDFEPAILDPQAFGAFIKSEIATWAKVVKAAGIKAE